MGDRFVGERVPDVLGALVGAQHVAGLDRLGDPGNPGVRVDRQLGLATRRGRVDEAGADSVTHGPVPRSLRSARTAGTHCSMDAFATP